MRELSEMDDSCLNGILLKVIHVGKSHLQDYGMSIVSTGKPKTLMFRQDSSDFGQNG